MIGSPGVLPTIHECLFCHTTRPDDSAILTDSVQPCADRVVRSGAFV
ncbi:MAG: hypothetical protein MI923_26065 [Phycisphaerales bacterium]|nr:hypothetical protein [Phycisphaerales bacterium]